MTVTAPTPARGSLPVVIRTSSTSLPSRKPMTAVSVLETTRPGADSPRSYATLPWLPPRSISPRPPRMLPTGCRKRTVAGSRVAWSKCEEPMGSPSTSRKPMRLKPCYRGVPRGTSKHRSARRARSSCVCWYRSCKTWKRRPRRTGSSRLPHLICRESSPRLASYPRRDCPCSD